MAWFEENVVWFDISMEDMVFIQWFECWDELPEDFDRLSLRDPFFRFDEILQSTTFTVFVHQVNEMVCLDHLHKFDNVDIFLEQFDRFNLIFC